jgi:NAD(P)H-nitrite reductase large subunit
MRYVIVGNGVAGTKAAETIRKRDAQGEIIILSAEEVPFYRRPALVEHLAGRVSREGLRGRPASFYADRDIVLRLGTAAVGLDAAAHQLVLASGDTLAYDRLLLAVGVDRSPDWLPGANLSGVVSLRNLADVAALRAAAERARRAVVVGEGVLGLEMARALRILGLPVVYLLEWPRFWPKALSPDASALVEERLRSEGVEVWPGQHVREFQGSAGRVRVVLTTAGERVPADLVGAAAGMRPPLSWAKAAGLRVDGRVWADDYLATNLPDVYAAGDAVHLPDETIAFGWQRAWHQGVVAGVNMTAGRAPYRRRTISLSTKAFGLPILVIGDASPKGRARRLHGDYPQGGVYKELILDEQERVVGAVMIGEVSEASRVEALVRQRIPYDQVDPELLRRLFDLRYWAPAGSEVLCPVCKFLVQIGEEELRQGQVTCPICGAEFTLRQTGDRLDVVLEDREIEISG